MRGFTAFIEKEFRELIRTKRMMILLIVFIAVGILNPATAKLTPKLLEMEADSLASMGMTVNEISITALDSWVQFAKNTPIVLIVTLIIFSGIYTSEYTKGTLIPLLTKGLSRSSVVLSKYVVMFVAWSIGIWLCFGITYFYGDFYWDNSVVKGLAFAGFCLWLFGVMMVSSIVFFSSIASSAGQVILGAGGLYFVMMIAGISKKASEYLPTKLLAIGSLYTGELVPSDYTIPAIIAAIISVTFIIAAFPLTHKRQI